MTPDEVITLLCQAHENEAHQPLAHVPPDLIQSRIKLALLKKIQKKISNDAALLENLWNTNIPEAQILVAMTSHHTSPDINLLKHCVETVQHPHVADALIESITPDLTDRKQWIDRWTSSPKEMVRRCGYTILALSGPAISEADCMAYLWNIVRDIHESPNFAREAINKAVIAIGQISPRLNKEALFAVTQIGPVVLDHTDAPDALKILTDKKLQDKFKKSRL